MQRRNFIGLLLVCWFCAPGGAGFAADAAAGFEAANRLYEQGKFPEAVAAYESLLNEGRASVALLFNLGNAQFKSGRVGKALASFRRAERLAPRDPDIRANLEFARNSVLGNNSVAHSRWARWLAVLSADELAIALAVAAWLWFGVLAALQCRPGWRRSLGQLGRLLGGLTLAVFLWLAALLGYRQTHPMAVVVATDAVVHYGPFAESPELFIARDGTELWVQDRKEDWWQVSDRTGRKGWLRNAEVRVER